MGGILFDERPLVVSPKLAEALGSLDEAVMLQQVHYWVQKSNHIHDGRHWVYNTQDAWMGQFPWIKSKTTLKRHFGHLVKLGLLIKGNYNKAGFDRTTWYAVDYEQVKKLESDFESERGGHSMSQNLAHDEPETDPSNSPNLADGRAQNWPTNTIDYPESNPQTTAEKKEAGQGPASQSIPYKEILDYLNQKTGSHYKDVKGNQKLIRARWREGYRLDDFRKVIDNKTADWKGLIAKDGRDMSQYLRPSTLFGPKFDQYLNEVVTRDNTQAGSLFDQQWTPESDDDLPF